MNLDDIKVILDLVREHDLAEFELERDGLKVRIRKGSSGQFLVQPAGHPAGPLTAPPPAAQTALPAVAGGPAAGRLADGPDVESVELAVVKSPIVGTLYRAAEPGAPPFVEVGGRVRKGQVLCIIEAMKLMNEIESEYDGELVNIYVENGKPVQFGERLFAIKVA